MSQHTTLPSAALALALLSHSPVEAEAGTLSAPLPRRVAPKAKRKVARCLPVVAPKCGCVYSCGVGWPVGKKGKNRYRVRHSFWGKSLLRAKVHNWCVSKRCTLAFHAEIICGGICPRRPANATCGFVRRGKVELCMSGVRRRGRAQRVSAPESARDGDQSVGSAAPRGRRELMFLCSFGVGVVEFDAADVGELTADRALGVGAGRHVVRVGRRRAPALLPRAGLPAAPRFAD